MRFGKIVVLGTFLCTSIANAQDVTVDLSVLDDLEAPTTHISKPLFPVLPKTPKAEVKKVKPKQENKKVKNLWDNKYVKPADDDIVVVDVEPAPQKKVFEPSVNNKNNFYKSKKRYAGYKNKYTNKNYMKKANPDIEQKTEAKPVIEQKTEAKPVIEPVAKEVAIEPVAEVTNETPKEVVTVPAVETTKEINVVNSNIEKTVSEKVAADVVKSNEDELIIKEEAVKETNNNQIKFADDVDELNDAQMQQIDGIVSKFKNESKNKIAIYSYNYDDGIDSFKKKRISLNRAVEVRSYLLKKGYKNFSIKVININSASDKINMVELQEI